MMIRIVFAVVVLSLLLPHEPNLGLPRLPPDSVSQVLSSVRENIMTRASRAVGELRQYDGAARLRRVDAEGPAQR